MDFSQYSIEQLEGFQKDIAREIDHKRSIKRRELVSDLQRLAREAGVSLDELLGEAGGKKAAKAKTKGSVAAKYRNPNDASQTWTGRGRQPLWVVALLAAGKKLEDLAI